MPKSKGLFAKLQGTQLEGFDPVDQVDKLQIIDVVEGDGDPCPEDAEVKVHYTGALCSNGIIFQSSRDMGRPITFKLFQVIEGWQLGMPGMKPGGTRRLIIPAEQAYGHQSPDKTIPPNSDLVFDIELIEVK